MNTLPRPLATQLDELISKFELDRWQTQIRSLARLTCLLPVEPADDLALGATRIGGTPDLPPHMAWPVLDPHAKYAKVDPRFLTFVAQINLKDVPTQLSGLPQSGWLGAFAVQEDSDDNPNVVYFFEDAIESLRRHVEPPQETYADECAETFGTLAVKRLIPAVSLPSHFQWTDDEDEFINEGHADQYNDLASELLACPEQKQPISRLGGYPSNIGGTDVRDHHLVLLIESWFGPDFVINFWDAGSQQFIAKSLQPDGDRIPETMAPITSM